MNRQKVFDLGLLFLLPLLYLSPSACSDDGAAASDVSPEVDTELVSDGIATDASLTDTNTGEVTPTDTSIDPDTTSTDTVEESVLDAAPETSEETDGDQDLLTEPDTDPVLSSAYCSTNPMDEIYAGYIPPNPYETFPSADECAASPHDVIIVFGCPNEEDGRPAACQISRADIAVKLRDGGYADQIITTGGAVHNDYVEAETLQALLLERGVPADDITLEPQAEHTDENIYFSSLIMEERGWETAILVSEDPGQLMMTALCDSNCCVDLGRLTLFEIPVQSPDSGHIERINLGHYVLYPWADTVTTDECNHIELFTKAMCITQDSRRACADDFQL